ncbi:MAG: hypothetical protein ABW178_02365 [Pseudoxanthomonas sp.]
MHDTLRQTLDHLPSLYRRALQPDGRLMAVAVAIGVGLVAAGANVLAALAAVLCAYECICQYQWTLVTEDPKASRLRALGFAGFALITLAPSLGDMAWALGGFALVQAVMALYGALKGRDLFLDEVSEACQASSAHQLLEACKRDREMVEAYLAGNEHLAEQATMALQVASLRLFRQQAAIIAKRARLTP